MKASAKVARLPEVQLAVASAAARLEGILKTHASSHGGLTFRISHQQVNAVDWEVYYTAYDEQGQGFAASLEYGHINVPFGGSWVPGIHILRSACREAEIR